MINPHKPKYHAMYWEMALAAARNSTDSIQVGAIVVTPTGMLSVGWNGMPAGFPNACEHNGKTRPEVIHAERNAIDKMTRQGVPTLGCILFVTLSPCFECAKSLLGLGLNAIYYDQTYKDTSGVSLLNQAGIPTIQRSKIHDLSNHRSGNSLPMSGAGLSTRV